MKFTIKILSTLFIVSSLALLFACGNENYNTSASSTAAVNADKTKLSIDTFATFPAEIDGCSCYFSNDSTEFRMRKYIYMNDYAQTAFLKINGVLTKFKQTDFKEIDSSHIKAHYKSEFYEMTIEVIDGPQSGYETMLKTGTIKLSDKSGQTITSVFYGECGC